MGGKKKGGDAKKKAKKEGDEEDLSMENFWKLYKKKVVEYNIDMSPYIKKAMEAFFEDQEEIKKIHCSEELGWPGIKALCESFKTVK